jgi:hypothetical protein
MMFGTLTGRPAARKLAALGILAAVVLTLYAGLIGPMLEQTAARRESAATLQSALDRYTQAAKELPQLEAHLAALERERQGESGYIDAANETLAAAAVQSRIKSAVGDAGGKLHSVEVLRPEAQGALQKIVVRARVAIALPGLQRVFHALNETAPILFFDALDIARADASVREAAEREARLDVDFTVFGYLRRPG